MGLDLEMVDFVLGLLQLVFVVGDALFENVQAARHIFELLLEVFGITAQAVDLLQCLGWGGHGCFLTCCANVNKYKKPTGRRRGSCCV